MCNFIFNCACLLQEVERLKRAMPCLKHCRGDPFKEEHWGALLQVGLLQQSLHVKCHWTFEVHSYILLKYIGT